MEIQHRKQGHTHQDIGCVAELGGGGGLVGWEHGGKDSKLCRKGFLMGRRFSSVCMEKPAPSDSDRPSEKFSDDLL